MNERGKEAYTQQQMQAIEYVRNHIKVTVYPCDNDVLLLIFFYDNEDGDYEKVYHFDDTLKILNRERYLSKKDASSWMTSLGLKPTNRAIRAMFNNGKLVGLNHIAQRIRNERVMTKKGVKRWLQDNSVPYSSDSVNIFFTQVKNEDTKEYKYILRSNFASLLLSKSPRDIIIS